jgi:integrase
MKARLEKRKNGYYYIVVDMRKEGRGRNVIGTGVKKKPEAEKIFAEVQHEINTNTYAANTKSLFTDFLQDWLDNQVTLNCRESTKQAYQLCLNTHIIPYFERLKLTLKEITPSTIQRYYNTKLKEGLSANTIRHHHANIRKALDHAKKMQLIAINPADGVELPKKKKYRGKFYSREEVIKLLKAVEGDVIEPAVILAVTLGLRRGEVLGLRWSDVDFESGSVMISNTRTRYIDVVEDVTKNEESTRDLFLPGYVLNYLAGLKNSLVFDSKYVVSWPDGTPLKPDYLSKKFKRILEANNLPIIRFHDLRHTNASLLLAQGVDMKRIQAWLGHAQLATTSEIYAHLVDDFKRDNASIIDQLLEK